MIKKSTTGATFFLGECLVAWHSKKQNCVTLSTCESEYVVATACYTQLIWMDYQLSDLGIQVSKPISIMCDNLSAIQLSKNPIMHSRTKHVAIKIHFLRDKVLNNELKLVYVPTQGQVVDIFTKALPRELFEQLRTRLGVFSQSMLI